MPEQQNPYRNYQVTEDDMADLFKEKNQPESDIKKVLFAIGVGFSITLAGALWGYVRAYNRKLHEMDIPPTLTPLHPLAKRSMIIFGTISTLVSLTLYQIISNSIGDLRFPNPGTVKFLLWVFINSLVTIIVMRMFNVWRDKEFLLRTNLNMFGSARLSTDKDLADLTEKPGFYIGGGYSYPKQGHLISVAGTRSGKFTNLIAPNLLGAGGYDGSWFVIDPKGEAAAVTAVYQHSLGRNVHVLDPWKIYSDQPSTFNPLDIIPNNNLEGLADDATMIAQMLVPENPNSKDPYWDNSARAMITAMIMHAILVQAKEDGGKIDLYGQARPLKPSSKRSLTTIWQWLRLSPEKFADLLFEMSESENEIIKASAFEVLSVKENTTNGFGSILSTAQSHTDFLKSPALQESISRSSFDIRSLTDGKSTIYVVIPPDKLDSHGKWLRLVVSTALRAVTRNKNKRVAFLLDEFSALGKIADIPNYMAMGAGYNISIWPIFQSLIQLKDSYGQGWEAFLGHAAIKHFFGVGDNFTAEYVSKMAGASTYIVYDRDIIGPEKGEPRARALVTADEVRRGSSNKIFAFVEQRPLALFDKFPYYEMPVIKDRAEANPYYVAEPTI
ncbi:type IV secretory system conjugative DNA transfer family protein [Dyadobacter sp. CY356]|uniref:type IV secretory system conjugative DNA transfer family protein n=1 Tax=Dyadobacter sp. CY356 TaxID=2906442 RepID=UPI001F366A58|nr:type IV secretory system conjugative DNA transfer family protein [Dyadobacter sp. CY356]MCF0055495.1 type IV secretory system conjugative DNA transfer family protein [Dyadobacter sp. CY356]